MRCTSRCILLALPNECDTYYHKWFIVKQYCSYSLKLSLLLLNLFLQYSLFLDMFQKWDGLYFCKYGYFCIKKTSQYFHL